MQRMRLVHPDRLVSPSTSNSGKEKDEQNYNIPSQKKSADVQLAELQDAFIRKQDKKKNQEERNMSDFAKKIKPLLAGNVANMEEVLKAFTGNDRIVAQNILNILARIPRVSLSNNKLLIDGEAVKEDLVQIIKEMMRNNVNGAESVVQILRGKADSSWQDDDDDDESMPFARSFDETLVPYLSTQAGIKSPMKGILKTPGKALPPPVHQSTPMPPPGKKSPPYKLRGSSLLNRSRINPIAPKSRKKLNKSQTASPRKTLQKLQAQETKDARNRIGYGWINY